MNNDRFKFRGRRLDNGGLVYGSLLRDESGWYIATFEQHLVDPDVNAWELDMVLVGIIEGSQEQCTGLKDKKGNLIFEGDVVTVDGHCEGDYWCDEYNVAVAWLGDCYLPLDLDEDWINVEVIGNIHDNPELLKNNAKK